jgi:RNA polymerase sigma factor (sigma-70 family)
MELHALRSATDEELLRRFIETNDEAAFRIIAERHGPMVLQVCRRALRCPQDVDDAFQATFLVFSKRAASIRKSASLGSWLHGVALRICSKLRRAHARRKRHEHALAVIAPTTVDDQLTWSEIKIGLDEELKRLPEQYRSVLIHCYLEGQTRDEAAGQLGLTPSALHGRLERGRKLLAARLRKRGLALSAAFLPIALDRADALAAIDAVTKLRDQQLPAGTIAPRVLSLTNELLKGTIMTKAKWATAAVVCSAMLAIGVGYTTAQPPAVNERNFDMYVSLFRNSEPPKKSDVSDNLKNTLLALDKHMWEAGAKGDWQERQKFLADDLVSISIRGKYGKADAAAADKRRRTTDWTIRDAEVVRVSPDVAMLTYRYDCKIVTAEGKVLETRKDHRIVYTWAHRNGGWVIVFSHDDHGPKAKDVDLGVDGGFDLIHRSNPLNELPSPKDKKGTDSNSAAGTSSIEFDQLRLKVFTAKLAVKEKQLKLDRAIEKNADRLEIELYKIDLDQAKLLVQEAELNLSAAMKKAEMDPFSNTKPQKR